MILTYIFSSEFTNHCLKALQKPDSGGNYEKTGLKLDKVIWGDQLIPFVYNYIIPHRHRFVNIFPKNSYIV